MDTTGGCWKGRKGCVVSENNMETYIAVCKIDSQWEFALSLGELKPGLCNNLEGWDGVGGGRKFQEGGDMYTYG